jgi:hypothetical protein
VADFVVLAAATVQSAVPGESGPAHFEEDYFLTKLNYRANSIHEHLKVNYPVLLNS